MMKKGRTVKVAEGSFSSCIMCFFFTTLKGSVLKKPRIQVICFSV